MRKVLLVLGILFGICSAQNTTACFQACGTLIPGPHEVKIGSYINSVAALNVEESHVRFDAYVWIRWERCAAEPNGATVLRPDLTINPENVIQRVDLTFKPLFEEPVCDVIPGGEYVYQIWRFEGQFHQKLNYRKYPLDVHFLKIKFEDNLYSRNFVKYVKDDLVFEGDKASGISDDAYLPGWTISNFKEEEKNSQYKTNWGAETRFYSADAYSSYIFSIKIDRGAAVYILKLLPPVLITLSICGIVFLMDVEALDVRIATAVGALLSLVFLQLSFSDKLPKSLDYMTLMDWIFDVGYVLTMSVVIECIVIRKIYYTYLDQAQELKENIQMSSLDKLTPSQQTNITEEEVLERMKDHKRRKDKVKLRIRRIEKVLFWIYMITVAFCIFFTSLVAKFVPD